MMKHLLEVTRDVVLDKFSFSWQKVWFDTSLDYFFQVWIELIFADFWKILWNFLMKNSKKKFPVWLTIWLGNLNAKMKF